MDRKQQFFVWLTAIFVAALVTGDFIGGRFFVLFGHTFSAGIIPFPLTFVLTEMPKLGIMSAPVLPTAPPPPA